MSLVYCKSNNDLFVSLDIEFKINYFAAVLTVAACYFVTQLIPIIWKLVSKSSAGAAATATLFANAMRAMYAV